MDNDKTTVSNIFENQINDAKTGWEFTTTVINSENSVSNIETEKENN